MTVGWGLVAVQKAWWGCILAPQDFSHRGQKSWEQASPYLGHTLLIPRCPVWHQCYGSLAAAIGCTWAGSQRIELSWVTRT